MNSNPVWQESFEILLKEGHAYPVYFYLLVVLAPVEFLSLYLPSLDAQTWSGSASLFRVSSATALLVVTYFSLRVANQEFAPWRFKPVKAWIKDAGVSAVAVARARLAFLAFHIGLSLFLCAPFLVWAGAIARTPMAKIAITFGLLVFYAFTYSVWGLVALSLWERRPEARQVFVRCLFFVVVLLSALVYLPANPIAFLLAFLSEQPLAPLRIAGSQWQGAHVHLTLHLLLAGAGVAAHSAALKVERTP
jgi:hypothetical protein